MSPIKDDGLRAPVARGSAAARKRSAVETFARHEATLRRTAARYSLCADDADDALQRGLEILLTKAPSDDPRELIRWTQTVVKHEALAIRRDRERILGGPAAVPSDGGEDWVALIPADADGPPERVERGEAIARSREALQALKPQELRALSLLAEGYSYAEIGEITGFSRTKINRCLAEGRERFRSLVARSEDGRRCAEMGPLLSAFCDGEAGAEEAATLREHLRACAYCRATLRAYRATPSAVAALAPGLPLGRSLFERAHDALGGLASRFGGGGAATDSTLSQVATAGGARGAGMAALAKVLAICAGTAGGAAACVAAGVVPAPLDVERQAKAPMIERGIDRTEVADWAAESGPEYVPAPAPAPEPPAGEHPGDRSHQPSPPQPQATAEPAASGGAVEYAPEPAPSAEPAATDSAAAPPSSGAAAGEFGP